MKKNLILLAVAFVLAVAVFSRSPIRQDPGYHVFADTRTMLGVPNAVNVLSNIGFVLAGAWGAAVVLLLLRAAGSKALNVQYLVFFSGVLLSGIGSMYYHLGPTNGRLVWDRLPMAVAFMGLFSTVVSEVVDRKTGTFLLLPLLAIGVFSVAYWAFTEQAGQGDLRPYVLVQFLPVLLIPLILVLYRPAKVYAFPIWLLTGVYVLSKIFEALDRQLYEVMGISGHTMKHLAAAAGIAALIRMLNRQKGEGT